MPYINSFNFHHLSLHQSMLSSFPSLLLCFHPASNLNSLFYCLLHLSCIHCFLHPSIHPSINISFCLLYLCSCIHSILCLSHLSIWLSGCCFCNPGEDESPVVSGGSEELFARLQEPWHTGSPRCRPGQAHDQGQHDSKHWVWWRRTRSVAHYIKALLIGSGGHWISARYKGRAMLCQIVIQITGIKDISNQVL